MMSLPKKRHFTDEEILDMINESTGSKAGLLDDGIDMNLQVRVRKKNFQEVMMKLFYQLMDKERKNWAPFTFHSDSGVTFIMEDKENLMEYFEKYFDKEAIDYLVTETNRFANQCFDENADALSPKSWVNK